MQGSFGFAKTDDFSGDRARIGLSGGINSAALLCYLATEHPEHKRPRWLGLYYAHLREHSPRTFRFVKDAVRYARRKFPQVAFGMHRCSAVDYFEAEKFLPRPQFSPCTEHLKIVPMERWDERHGVTIDLIGFVRHEMSRRGEKHLKSEADLIRFPIAHLTEDDCYRIVDREIGWHPPIYDIRDEKGRRVFTHNNCLPCKNMTRRQLEAVREHFPAYYERAMKMACRIGRTWGRKKDEAGDPCALCTFD
jgi:3'-phosphoadenosine 5'-phosphosulfate sulfotransferase (PAPS reductase)/FAD synthetase